MKRRKKILLTTAILLIVIAAGGIYAYKEYNRKHKDLADTKPDFTLASTAVISEFSADEKKAGSQYNGKILVISGYIKSVDKDHKGLYTIVVGDTSSPNSVRCSMDSTHNAEATVLKQGLIVSMKGICTGYNADEMGLGADVILNRSIIEKTVN